jgi:hypothetical protein
MKGRIGSAAVTDGDAFAAFGALPRRVFLDSSTLQTLSGYGSFIWEGEAPAPTARIRRVPDGLEELEALRDIFLVNERAQFEFALSANSLAEVEAKGDLRYLSWAYDVLDHWEACLAAYEESPFSGAAVPSLDGLSFGYLSAKDRLLLQDALAYECDAFLTMERRLASPLNVEHLRRITGLLVLRPTQYWRLLYPWAALHR